MKGVYTAKVKEITILGVMNDINVQVKMEVDYGEGVSGIDVVKQITEFWRNAGMLPPVRSNTKPYKTTAQQNGATGTHPDEKKPYFLPNGERHLCPNCGRPTIYFEGVTKDPNSKNYMQPWKKWVCLKSTGGCGAYNFNDRQDARFDK
jgi:hypothetical protein